MKKEDFLESFKDWYEEYGGKNPEYYTQDRCLYWVLQDVGMLGEEPDIYTLFDLIETVYIWYSHIVDVESSTCQDFAEVSWLFMETYFFDIFSSYDSWPLISRILKYTETVYSFPDVGREALIPTSGYLELLAGTCIAWFFELTEDNHGND